MRRILVEKFEGIHASLDCLENQVPCPNNQLADNLKFITEFLPVREAININPGAVEMLQSFTDKNYCLRVAQYRLQNCKAFMIILSYMQVSQVVRLQ